MPQTWFDSELASQKSQLWTSIDPSFDMPSLKDPELLSFLGSVPVRLIALSFWIYQTHPQNQLVRFLLRYPSKHKTFVYHLYNVGPTSSTLVQHCINVIQICCVCWDGLLCAQQLKPISASITRGTGVGSRLDRRRRR